MLGILCDTFLNLLPDYSIKLEVNMFSDTGNVSLWLGIFFILTSLSGIFVIYSIIKNKSIENENIDKIIELGKWFIVSVAITLSVSIVNDGFREREQDIKEMEIFDKYVDTILEAAGVEKKKVIMRILCCGIARRTNKEIMGEI